MMGSLLEGAVSDNEIFFSESGFSQKILLKQGNSWIELRGIFSRVENIADPLNMMVFEQFQAQITLPTKYVPNWFSRKTQIFVEDSQGVQHEYFMEKRQNDDMLGRMHIWLKKVGKMEISV